MMWRICETCAHSAWRDGKTAVTEVCLICTFGKDGQPTNWKEKSMTNADKIRSMSNEELAAFLDATQYREWEEIQENEDELHSYRRCVTGWLAWLEQPYEGE